MSAQPRRTDRHGQTIVATTEGWVSPLTDEQYASTYHSVKTLALLRGMDFSTGAPPRFEGLALVSADLCAQYGFDQGRYPAWIREFVTEWYDTRVAISEEVWQPVLWDLVHEHLLPAMRQHRPTTTGNTDAEVPPVSLYRLPTLHHNPVRAQDDLAVIAAPTRVYVPWLEVFTRIVVAIEAQRAGRPRSGT